MYRIIKPEGAGANVSVENMETHASVIIGRLTIKIIDMITEDKGDSFKLPEYSSAWDISISQDAAKALVATTMHMKKPIRDQRKKPTEDKPTGKIGVDIDAFDLIYGI